MSSTVRIATSSVTRRRRCLRNPCLGGAALARLRLSIPRASGWIDGNELMEGWTIMMRKPSAVTRVPHEYSVRLAGFSLWDEHLKSIKDRGPTCVQDLIGASRRDITAT
jgi:hypothetical protein